MSFGLPCLALGFLIGCGPRTGHPRNPGDDSGEAPELVAGGGCTCVYDPGGDAHCWQGGPSADGGTPVNSCPGIPGRASLTGVKRIRQVALSQDHGCAVGESNDVYCWGANDAGQLGDGRLDSMRAAPEPVLGVRASQVATANGSTCAVGPLGQVMCWGQNAARALGVDADPSIVRPVEGLDDVQEVAMGDGFACARRVDSSLACWGRNVDGALGDGTLMDRPRPITVGVWPVRTVAAGAHHACAIVGDQNVPGELWCWGANARGQLGDGETRMSLVPIRARLPGRPLAVSAGQDFTCALLETAPRTRSVFCWGADEFGQLGDRGGADHPLPIPVMSVEGAMRVAAGQRHACALFGSDRVACWGDLSGSGEATAAKTSPGGAGPTSIAFR